jgi:iron transport multicopper oxidase
LPPIDVTLGDKLTVNIKNNLDVATSLHSHGLYFINANYMDGAPGITECGIPPGGMQTYVIPIEQTGTYWAHSHTRGQYVDGFQTSFVIHAPDEKITQKYDEEYVLSFSGILNLIRLVP